MPSDAKLEGNLRNIVQDLYQNGNLEDLTVKRVRASCEVKLKLPKDFFKNDEAWKDKSKKIIQGEVVSESRSCNGHLETRLRSVEDAHNDKQPESLPKPKTKQSPFSSSHSNTQNKKRKPSQSSPVKSRKKRRSSSLTGASVQDENEDSAVGTVEQDQEPTEDLSTESIREAPAASNPQIKHRSEADDSESDMSVVIDEEPKAKRKKRSKSEDKPKQKGREPSKAKKAPEAPGDEDAEEIKRLQGWLVKCGIRKMWFKELAPYDTSKAKIRHLREMLADAGMTGRYSKEKAEQIREERELKADLEAVTEGNKAWGTGPDDEEEPETGGRPKRKLARGFQGLDFLNDDEGEETD